MKHVISGGNLAVLNADNSTKYLFCPYAGFKANCSTMCPLFEVVDFTEPRSTFARLHCAPDVREVELTEQFTKKG